MQKEFIIIHESLLESWLKDFGSFGVLFFMLYANYVWLGDHIVIAFSFVVMLVLIMLGRAGKTLHHFHDREEAKSFIDKI